MMMLAEAVGAATRLMSEQPTESAASVTRRDAAVADFLGDWLSTNVVLDGNFTFPRNHAPRPVKSSNTTAARIAVAPPGSGRKAYSSTVLRCPHVGEQDPWLIGSWFPAILSTTKDVTIHPYTE